MAAILTQNPPSAQITPQGNPAAGINRPPLQIITLPMWMWVATPPAMQTTIPNDPAYSSKPAVVTDTVVIDEVDWFQDYPTPVTTTTNGANPVCGNRNMGQPWAANGGPGVPYDPSMDPSNANNVVPQACIQTFTVPYYSTSYSTSVGATATSTSATTVDGVHTLQAVAYWHVAYTVNYTDPAGNPGTANGTTPATASPVVASLPVGGLSYRIGEIQALAINP